MKEERPVTPEMAKALAQQLKDALAAGKESADLDFGGHSMHLERTGDGGYAVGVPGQEGAARMYFEPADRPESYPEDLPFVPGESVSVADTARGVALMYFAPADPQALVLALARQSISAGWQLAEERALGFLGITHTVYRKAPRERLIMNAQGIISLFDQLPR